MKKLLLLSVLALGGLTASAQSFSDYYKVTFNGQEVKNGETIASEETVETEWYECDFEVTLKGSGVSSAELWARGEYTGQPSYMMSMNDPVAWGSPSICYSIPATGENNCEASDNPELYFSNFSLSTVNEVIYQFHVASMGTTEIGPDFDPKDPSTWPVSILPSEIGLYKVTLYSILNGSNKTSDFTLYVLIGPKATGVDSIEADYSNAPVEYFDLMGRRVLNPSKGQIVIERQGSKTVKKVIL